MNVPSVSEMFHGIEDEESGRTKEMQNEHMKKEVIETLLRKNVPAE